MLKSGSTYDEVYDSFSWNIPERYNIANDVCDRWADNPERVALIYEDGEGEEEDSFDFDDSNPDDLDNMTGELVTIVITEVSPVDKVNKGDSLRIKGYAEDQNGTKLPNFEVGFGMWDKEHTEPAFEIGQGLTNSSGHFDVNATDFLAAILGENEIYAASYKQGFLGVDGPKDIDVFSDAVLVMLIKKCEILLNGFVKRNKIKEIAIYKRHLTLIKTLVKKSIGMPEKKLVLENLDGLLTN